MGKSQPSNNVTETGRPRVNAALRKIMEQNSSNNLDVDRINIRFLASGEVAYRIHPADGDFYDGGVIRLEKD